MDAQGRIVTAQGNVVQPAITIPQNSTGLTINPQGQVSVMPQGATAPTIIGQLTLTRFVNQAGLLSIGDNLLPGNAGLRHAAGRARRPPTASATCSRAISSSPTSTRSTEISDLIAAQRAYEMNSQGDHRRRPDAVGDLQPDALR